MKINAFCVGLRRPCSNSVTVRLYQKLIRHENGAANYVIRLNVKLLIAIKIDTVAICSWARPRPARY